MAGGSSIWTKPFIALWVVLSVCTLVSLAVYTAFKIKVDQDIDEASELCSTDFVNIDYFKDAPTQTMKTYVYNLSNPTEYLAGGNAEFHEKGPYSFDLKIRRSHLKFYDSGKELNFTSWNSLSFNEGDNCKGCGHVFTEQVTSPNPVYMALVSNVGSEAVLYMSGSCSRTQLVLLKTQPAAPYCRKSDLGTATACRCCVPPVDGFVSYGLNESEYEDDSYSFCSELTSAQGTQAGLISWLGMYDGAHKLDSERSTFPLASGTYTPLLRTYSVSEMLTGSMSALAGTFNFIATSQTYMADPEAAQTYYGIINATQDMKDVCYNTNYDFCPQLSEIMAEVSAISGANPQQIQALRVRYLQGIRCSGNIPDYENLISVGQLSEERALQLRYLEGLPCNNFAAAIAFAALLNLSPANTGTCADGTQSFPCCLSQFSLNNGASTGSGIGCLRFVEGVIQRKRVFSAEDARDVLGTTVSQRTACTSSNELQLHEWFGRRRFDEWYTPAFYNFGGPGASGVMPWADPAIINTASSATGSITEVVVGDGRAVNQIIGRGLGKTFLARDLNGGNVEDREFDIYATNLLRVRRAEFIKNEYKFGLQAAKFQLKEEYTAEDPADEASEKSGQLPYPNLVNLVYTERGKPVIVSSPNYLNVNEAIYSQENNAKRSYPSGVGGVHLYRTREEYDADADEIEPVRMTASNVVEFDSDFETSWDYEPATGLTITNTVTGMFSLFTMNCNPLIDSFCNTKASNSDELCYQTVDNDGDPVTTPCSFVNVLTPKVQGEKVLPVYWNSVTARPPQSIVDRVITLLDIRFAFSILCIIFPILMFLLIIYTIVAQMRADDPAVVADPTPEQPQKGAEGDIALTTVSASKNI